MSLPKSVQAQSDAANALHQELYSIRDDQDGQLDDHAEEAPVESVEAEEPATAPQLDKDALYWEQRFQVIQGKYNTEVPELRQENLALKKQIDSLYKQLASSTAQSGKAAELADTLDANLSDEEMDLVGPELVSVIKKLIGNGNQSTVDPNELETLKTKVDSFERDKQEHTQATFWAEVNSRFPKWNELQNTPEAHAYFAGIDQQTGRLRNDVIREAQSNFDAATVVRMFQEIEALTKGKREIPANKQQPVTSRNSSQAQGEQKHIWSRAEITQFYTDKTQGRYKPDEAAQLEADIFAAQAEGRVR